MTPRIAAAWHLECPRLGRAAGLAPARARFQVHAFGYSSVFGGPDVAVPQLLERLADAGPLSLVGHSRAGCWRWKRCGAIRSCRCSAWSAWVRRCAAVVPHARCPSTAGAGAGPQQRAAARWPAGLAGPGGGWPDRRLGTAWAGQPAGCHRRCLRRHRGTGRDPPAGAGRPLRGAHQPQRPGGIARRRAADRAFPASWPFRPQPRRRRRVSWWERTACQGGCERHQVGANRWFARSSPGMARRYRKSTTRSPAVAPGHARRAQRHPSGLDTVAAPDQVESAP